jgi:hypothetical protein
MEPAVVNSWVPREVDAFAWESARRLLGDWQHTLVTIGDSFDFE